MGTEDEILLGIDEGRGLLDQDNVPNENQSLTCFSCDARMLGLYCHECGNKNDNYRRSVFSLLIELIQNLTAMDNRMWRSLRSIILRPGHMSRGFADGARSRWTSPVRFYIAASILLFGYITVSQTQIIAIGNLHEDQARPILNMSTDAGKITPKLHFFIRKDQMVLPDNDDVSVDSDSLFRGFRDGAGRGTREGLQTAIDEIDARIEASNIDSERRALSATRQSLAQSLAKLDEPAASSGDDINDATDGEARRPNDFGSSAINITGLDGRRISLDRDGFNALIDLMMRRPELFNEQVNDSLKLALFFMMPFAMLIGAIFIRGRSRAMLYDHLVHAAYIHAFSYVLLFVFILLHQFTTLTLLILPYTLILLIYLPLSAKSMFQRGWFKSFLTAYGVGIMYSLVMMVAFTGILVQAVNNVAADLTQQRELMEAVSNRALVSDGASDAAGVPDPPVRPQDTESDGLQ